MERNDNFMEKNNIQERLSQLTKKDMEISKLTDLTVYEVSRIVDWDYKNKFSVSFYIAEFFNNKPAKHQHTIYRHYEADAYEILSLLLRLEKQFDRIRNAYIKIDGK
ncbi:MAG TPA: hypothetical protein DGJ56_09915 [Verrucomicrobiales bacterium]|mgnify:FL=1|nr:hypothetical protein [Verrucomicrobiales bacterium]